MSTSWLKGLIPFSKLQDRLLQHLGRENDDVARAQARYSLAWRKAQAHPDLVVRVGDRLFVLDEPARLDAFAEALGLKVPAPKPVRARRAAAPSNMVAVA